MLTVKIVASGQGSEDVLHNSKTEFLLLYKSYRGRKSVNSTLSNMENTVSFKKAWFLAR